MITEDIVALQNIEGANEKLAYIKRMASNESFRMLLYYALNPMLSYNLSEKTLRSNPEQSSEVPAVMFHNIFECCEFLSGLRGLDNATISQVKAFLYNMCEEEEREIYIKLLSRTLRLGVTAKSVNKEIPGLIPEWEVQQSFPIEKYPVEPGQEFWLTQKLNGVRATFYKGQLIARSGIPYAGLEHIISAISNGLQPHEVSGYVLDGELTLLNPGNLSDNEAFREAAGILNSDSADKSGILYTVFDMIPVNDFESANPKTPYSLRRHFMNCVAARGCFSSPDSPVRILPTLYNGTDINVIEPMLERMVHEDKEGLILNLDVPYKRARHRGILKIKRFYTMDLPVVGFEEGNGRLLGTLGALVLRYKNNKVRVGSGFSDDQRSKLWMARENLIGTICEVKYKETSYDKDTGMESLQFPVFVCLRTDKDSASYG